MTPADALRTAAAIIELPGRGQVRVTGADAQSYLQSLLSQDLAPLRAGDGAHALLLQPQGKLEADLRVLVCAPDEIWLDCEDAPAAVAALSRFKIRVDVTLTDLSAERAAVSVRGPDAAAVVAAQLGVDVPTTAHEFVTVDGCFVVRADWPGSPGVDILGPTDAVAAVVAQLGLPIAGGADAERLRIECGVPRQGLDIDDTTIPQEAFLERDAVSFTKGCFLGQELVCRIDSRGHVNRLLRILWLSEAVEPGTAITTGGRVVGAVTSVARAPEGAVALAQVRREVEPGAPVLVGAVDATVAAVPEP